MKQVVENRDWLIKRCIEGSPNELCGFIMRDGSVVELPNAARDPVNNFEMARHHLVKRVPDPSKIYAIWHSHPNGNSVPSATDMNAVKIGAVEHHWIYLIVTPNGVFEHIMELEDDESITVRTFAV